MCLKANLPLTISERPEGAQLWDQHRLIATVAASHTRNTFVLTFNNGDPLGWGAQYVNCEDAATYLALAYASELRAVKNALPSTLKHKIGH